MLTLNEWINSCTLWYYLQASACPKLKYSQEPAERHSEWWDWLTDCSRDLNDRTVQSIPMQGRTSASSFKPCSHFEKIKQKKPWGMWAIHYSTWASSMLGQDEHENLCNRKDRTVALLNADQVIPRQSQLRVWRIIFFFFLCVFISIDGKWNTR